MTSPIISGTFLIGGVGISGAGVQAWKASRFGAVPGVGSAPPSGSPDATGVSTSASSFGTAGGFQIQVPTSEPYYVQLTFPTGGGAVNYWQLHWASPGAHLNILDFGTNVGTGSQSIDDAAIAAAYAACLPGQGVYFGPPPSGQYLTAGNIEVPLFTRTYADAWAGTGGSAPIIKLINGSGATCVFGSPSYLATATSPGSDTGIIIDSLSIDVNGGNNPGVHGIVLCGQRCWVKGNFVNNPGGAGIIISDQNSQGHTSTNMVCQENRVTDNTVSWPSSNIMTAGQHGIWFTHTVGAHDNSDSWCIDNVVAYAGDNPFQFDSAGDLVLEGNHPWAILGQDAFCFSNVNRCRIANNIVDNFGFNSGSFTPTSVSGSTMTVPVALCDGTNPVFTNGMTVSGPGITGTATIAVNTSTGVLTLTGTIGTLVVGAYVFSITYRGFHFTSLNGTNSSSDDHSGTHLTGNQVHSNENNHNGYGVISATSTSPGTSLPNGTLPLSSTKAGEIAVGWQVTGPSNVGPTSVVTNIDPSTHIVTINDVTGTLVTGTYTFTPPGAGKFVYFEVDSVSGSSTVGILQLVNNSWKQDVAGTGPSTAYVLNGGSNELLVYQSQDDARGPTLDTTANITGNVNVVSSTSLPVTLVTSAFYQALPTDVILICEGSIAETIVTPLVPNGDANWGQELDISNPGTGLISISPAVGTRLPGVTTRTDAGASITGTTTLNDTSLVAADVGAFVVHANVPPGTTLTAVTPGTSGTLSVPCTNGSGLSVFISYPLQIFNNQAIQLVWDDTHNAWRFRSRAIATLGGSGLSQIGAQLNTLTSAGAVSNVLDDGNGNLRAGGYQSAGSTPPNPVPNAHAGSSATASVVGNDVAGVITLNVAGSGITAGTQLAFSYATPLPAAPNVVQLTSYNGATAAAAPAIVPTPGTGGFSVQFANAPSAGTYLIGYSVMS